MDRIVHMIMRRALRMLMTKATQTRGGKSGAGSVKGMDMGHTRQALKVLRRTNRF